MVGIRAPERGVLRLTSLLIASLTVAGCTQGQIGVDVIAPVVTWPPDPLILEVGPTQWELQRGNGGGVATVQAYGSQRVRLLRPSDCSVLGTFEAQVGRKYVLRVGLDDHVNVVDVTDGAFALGPGLPASQSRYCQS
jgi:hypothetical protein